MTVPLSKVLWTEMDIGFAILLSIRVPKSLGKTMSAFLVSRRGATIQNLRLDPVMVTGHTIVGALVGQARDKTLIKNCSARGTVRGRNSVGGLIGFLGDSDVEDSWADVYVSFCDLGFGFVIPGKWHGGFVGHTHPFRDTGREDDNVGDGSSITNCFSFGDVDGIYVAGGFVGNHHGADITDCISYGEVTAAYVIAGGFAGYVQVEPGVLASPNPVLTSFNNCDAFGSTQANLTGTGIGIAGTDSNGSPIPSTGGFIGYCEGLLDGANMADGYLRCLQRPWECQHH